jgi:L-lactate utilization protein LutC
MVDAAQNALSNEGYCCAALRSSVKTCATSMNIVIQKANASITDVTHMAMAKTRTIVQDRDETIAELLRLVDQQSHLIMLQSRIMEQLSNAIKGLSIILAFFVLCALVLKLSARRSKVEQQQKG